MTLTDTDTLTAVFNEIELPWQVGVETVESQVDLDLFPNPASDYINLSYTLTEAADVNIELHSVIGNKVKSYTNESGQKPAGKHSNQLSLKESILPGIYFLHLHINEETIIKKVNVIK